MRRPKFLSPSAIETWQSNREEYYLRYLAEIRPPSIPQSQAMSIGSAFDAYVKSELAKRLFGDPGDQDFDTLFPLQVEPHNRDWALEHGKIAFEAYRETGAYRDLLVELLAASQEPRFESTVQGEINGVPFLGKPDLFYVSSAGAHVILDWKVNGYCSNNGAGPKKGYVWCRPDNKPHRDAHLLEVGDLTINIGHFMEDVDKRWARQLAIYAWCLGEEVGANFVVWIEQLAYKNGKFRIASHRERVSQDFQLTLMSQAAEIWMRLNTGNIFDEDNDTNCKRLDTYYKAFEGESDDDKWFRETSRVH